MTPDMMPARSAAVQLGGGWAAAVAPVPKSIAPAIKPVANANAPATLRVSWRATAAYASAAAALGKTIAEQSNGTETDRAGRVVVEPDLTVKGHPYVFVIGDLAAVPGVPGMAQGAIQGANYATKVIKRSVKGHDDPATREPFKYNNKGSMATVSRFNAVAQFGKLEFGGFFAWLAWLVLHLFYVIGHKNRFTTIVAWFVTFASHSRSQMAITSQMIYARLAMQMLQNQQQAIAAVEQAYELERSEQKAGGVRRPVESYFLADDFAATSPIVS